MRAFLGFAPVVLALTACLGDGALPSDRLGVVSLRAYNNSGTPVVRGAAVFYQAPGLLLPSATVQDCAVFSYAPETTSDNAGRTLNAGASVNFTIGAFSEVALPAPNATYPVYNFASGSYLDFVSGDSALVTIPGAVDGFEAMSAKARLAEPFTADPLPAHVDNAPLNLVWQPAPVPGSIMVVSLRYNATPGATAPNVEIACGFDDDGIAQIPANFANVYAAAAPASRSYVFVRVRDRLLEFDARTRTRIRSIYEYPARSLVDAP
jgi:hypothetical protein